MEEAAMNVSELCAAYRRVRARSLSLAAPLSAEDCCAQAMPDASPVKWHLAHSTWFFETFVLEAREKGFKPFHPVFRMLFNSYYNAVGERYPRPQRGMLTRPTLECVLEYRAEVDRRMLELLAACEPGVELAALVTLGLHHEQQHQELILTDLKYLFFQNPLAPAYTAWGGAASRPPSATAAAAQLRWQDFPGGLTTVGHAGEGFCFDNETPRHRVFLEPYQLASHLVTNGEYLQFVAAGGYEEPAYWLAEGWDWRVAARHSLPLYWQRGDPWREFTLGGLLELDLQRPVVHVSYYEANAYAHWAGARLPSEQEWENAAAGVALAGHFADAGDFHPAAAGKGGGGMEQLFGDVWEWTASSYSPYPGFRTRPGAVGEYNGKFMVNQYVLRGGSCATPEQHLRASYRNFFPAATCWQFSGIRLARDAYTPAA